MRRTDRLLALGSGAIVGITGLLALFFRLFVQQPAAPAPWATAPDLEPVPALGRRLLVVLVDALNADAAFDPAVMPFVAGLRPRAAWGVARTGVLTMTGPAVLTLGTGRWPTLADVVENFVPPVAASDNLFRRLKDAGRTAWVVGDAVWTHRYRPWVTGYLAVPAGGIHDTHDSDAATAWAAAEILRTDRPDVVVAHFVGVDHTGHQFASSATDGPYGDRVRELDQDIRALVADTAPGTAVLVIADHGMTERGGHGGGEEKPRNAPFLLFGPGIRPGGPVRIAHGGLAYLGVPTPAEADALPATLLLAVDDAVASRIRRNAARQRHAALGSGRPTEPWRRAACWALIAAIGLLLLRLVVRATRTEDAGSGPSGHHRPALVPLLSLLALAPAAVLPPLGVGGLAALGLAGLDWSQRRRAPPRSRASRLRSAALLLGVAVAATAAGMLPPYLRWWPIHRLAYAATLRALAVAAAAVLLRRRRHLAAASVLLGAAGLGALLVAQYFDWPVPTDAPLVSWLVVLGATAVAARAGAPWAGAALGLLAAAHLVAPYPTTVLVLLCGSVPALVALARHGAVAAAAGIVLASSALLDGFALAGVGGIAALALGASELGPPARFRAWPLVIPPLVMLLEVVAYLALGKQYTFSSVQVALGFVAGQDFDIARTVVLVALGDALPWTLLVLAVARFGGRGGPGASHAREIALGAALAVIPLRFAAHVAIFPLTAASYWLTSSVLPFQAVTLTLALATLPALGLSLLATRPYHDPA